MVAPLYFDTLEKTLLHPVEHGIMLNDGEVLGLGEELLVRVRAGTKHLRLLGAHLAHLRRHLARRYTCQ